MNEPITIRHTKSGARAKVYPYGATITSYKTKSGKELLFESRLAKKDGSKAIRGGVPLVFPQFGQPNKDMPQHGFLRCNYWKAVGDAYDNADSAGCELSLDLKDVVNARGDGRWSSENCSNSNDTDCSLIFHIKVQPHRLTTTLTIKNTGGTAFDYQTLLHTYFKIDNSGALDKSACYVNGLDRYNVEDKVTGETYVQSDDPIIVDREVDRIYTPPKGLKNVDVVISTGKTETSKVNVMASAKMSDGTFVPVSAVVWNPHIEKAKAMGDFGDEQYQDMICVEPGILSGEGTTLKPDKSVVFTQVIRQVLPTDAECECCGDCICDCLCGDCTIS